MFCTFGEDEVVLAARERRAPLSEVRTQDGVQRHLGIGYELDQALDVVAMHMVGEVVEVLADVVMQTMVDPGEEERNSERIPEQIVDPGLVGMSQERISERIPEQIVASELVDTPRAQNLERIPEQIVIPGLVGIAQERIPERIPEQIVVSELVDIPRAQNSEQIPEQIVDSDLAGIAQERISERIPEQIVASELVDTPRAQNLERIPEQIVDSESFGISQERISERIPEQIVDPGLGVVDMNHSHAAEEAIRILRQVAVRRQAELVEEDVDDEEFEEEYEEEVYVPASRFPPGWQPMRMCRGFLAGGTGLCPYSQRCTFADPGVRGRAYDEGRLAHLGHLWWLLPDGKTQVTIEHVQQVDEIDAGTNGDYW